MEVTLQQKRVRSGYKQTEAGMLPKNWETKLLSEISDVVRGGSPRPAGDPRYFNGAFIPWLTVAALTNIPDSEMYVSETLGYLTEEGAKYSRTLEKDTLIIANSGATLGVAKILGVRCCANDGIAALLNLKASDKEFICHYLNTQTRRLREVVAPGNGQPNLNTGLIGGIRIPFPKLPEQHAVAVALSDVDALIASLDRLIAKKRDIKIAAMQQLLSGRSRLPGFSGTWERKTLRDISYMKGRIGWQGLKQSEFTMNPDEPYLITGMNFRDGEIQWEDVYHISFERYGVAEEIQLKPDDVLMTKDGTIGKLLFITEIPYPGHASLNSHLLVFRPIRDSYAPKFLYYQLASKAFRDYIELNKSGSTFFGISQQSVGKFPVALPPTKAEQTAIAAIISDMDTEISALEARRTKTQALKQGMLQQLLTGQIRLI